MKKLLAIAIVLVALVAVDEIRLPVVHQPFTEFYLLGSDGMADQFPDASVVGKQVTARVGIENRESNEHEYRIEVWVADPEHGRIRLESYGPFLLLPGNGTEEHVAWQMPWVGDREEVQFVLLTETSVAPYRQLHLWLKVVQPTEQSAPTTATGPLLSASRVPLRAA